MRITFLLLTINLLTIHAVSYTQSSKVSINLERVAVKEVLSSIEEQTAYKFLYSDDFIENQFVSIHVKNSSVADVLETVLKETGNSFREIENNLIVVAPFVDIKDSQELTIKGKVMDTEGGPLPGVNVIEKGTTNGAVTNLDGEYSISIQSPEAVLIFSYVGYLTEEIEVSGKTIIDVSLVEDIQLLDEVVVVGYGAVKKRDITGSISSIKEEEITAIPTSNVLESMQGKIAGLDMTNSSGALGSPLSFTVRGNRSLTASNDPLILVDGIAYGSDLTINPNDVESIEVLKDASTTAIYGSRGANGVILITTKKGKEGKAKVDFNAYMGPSMVTNLPSPNNTQEYVAFRREAMRAVGQWSSPADDALIWDAIELERIANGVNTNWYDIIFAQALTQNYQVSVSGGTEATKISTSINYMNETGVLKGEELARYDGRFNISQKIAKGIEAGASALFNYSVQDNVSGNVFSSAQTQVPYGVPYNEDGSVNKYPFTGSGSTAVNIMMNQDKANFMDETKSNRFFGTAYLNAELFKGMVFRTNLGFDSQTLRNGRFEGVNSTFAAANSGLARVEKTNEQTYALTWENTLTYSKEIGSQSFTVLLGHSMSKSIYEDTYAEGKGLSFEEAKFHNLDGTQQEFILSSSYTESSILSYFARLNYKLFDKYLITSTIRADGSSVLAEGNQWGYFPSVAVAWRLKDEDFLINVDQLSDLKLRFSYGLSGNSAVSPYQTSGALSKTIYAFDEDAAYGYRPYELANADLKWEKTRVFNTGVDFGLLNNKIYATIDAYKTWTDNLLLPMILPGHTGFTEVISNVGKTETQGVDISLNTIVVDKQQFKWSSNLIFSANKEEITALNSDQDDVASGWFIGHPTKVFYDYEKIGIWQTSEAAEAATYGQEPGDIKVSDTDGDGTIDATEDRMVIGQQTPKWTAGLNNRLEYKGLELSFFVYARIGQMINSDAAKNFHPSGWANSSVTDYWTPENPTNAYPRPNFNKDENMLYYSTLGYRNGNFVKIKNVTLGYNLPKSIIGKANMSQLRVYGTLKNFFTFSKFDDYDPERGGANSYPMTKQVVFGVNVSF